MPVQGDWGLGSPGSVPASTQDPAGNSRFLYYPSLHAILFGGFVKLYNSLGKKVITALWHHGHGVRAEDYDRTTDDEKPNSRLPGSMVQPSARRRRNKPEVSELNPFRMLSAAQNTP